MDRRRTLQPPHRSVTLTQANDQARVRFLRTDNVGSQTVGQTPDDTRGTPPE